MKMKNKRKSQISSKELHKERLAATKAKRRAEPILERPEPVRAEKPTILIVCEGKNTEPSYFRQFKLSSATIKTVGNGYNTVSLVDQAIQINMRGKYDQTWCVFDKDQFTAQDFNQAIFNAGVNQLFAAYSNQAFEYWLILHFNDHQGGGMDRKDYGKLINEYIKPFEAAYDYNGSKIISPEFFDILDGLDHVTGQRRLQLAIDRARRNYNQLDHHSPAAEESSTTVFKLIEEILKYI
jgi:RloB-like protein